MEEENKEMGGQPPAQPPPQQQPQPYYQQRYQPYPPPKQGNIAEGVIKNPVYIGLGIVVSVFLIWLGMLFFTIMLGVDDPGQMKSLFQLSLILYDLGIAGLVILMLFLGLGRWEYPQWVRAMLILGAVLLILWGFTSVLGILATIGRMATGTAFGLLFFT